MWSALLIAAVAPPAAQAGCALNLVVIPCLEATFPGELSLGSALDAGTTTTSGQQDVVVSSNQSWGLRIQSDLADGRMKQWNGASYVGSPRILTNPLRWALTSLAGVPVAPTYAGLTSTPTTVLTGQPTTGCVLGLTCLTTTVGIRHRLTTTFADRRVSPDSYRVRVTYTASHGF